jgi:predicted permease
MWQDVAYGFRTLSKRPGFVAVAVITLGLGVGVNTAVFSIGYGLMLRPLPVPDADRLVSIVCKKRDEPRMTSISFPDYLPDRALVCITTGNYFSTLGLDASLGRVYGPIQGDLGGEPVVVLGHGYWQSRFAGDPSVVGRTLTINRHPVTVIGVAPESFSGTVGLAKMTAYVPMSTWGIINPGLATALEDRRGSWRVVARMLDGVSVKEARAAVTILAAHLESEYPDTNTQTRAFVFPEPLTRAEANAASDLPRTAAAFMIMVGMVLLIACANVASLLLARAMERRREIAVRCALGAGRLRIARQLLVESMLVAFGGGIAGLVLAGWAAKLLSSIRIASDDLQVDIDTSIDLNVLGFALLVAVVAGLLAGLAPALHTVRSNLGGALKEGDRTVVSGGGRIHLRDLLVVGQVAVSLVLLVSTALLVRNVVNADRLDLGFETRNRLMLRVDTAMLDYDVEQGREFFRELLERVRALPGVRSAASSLFVPVDVRGGWFFRVFPEGEGTGTTDDGEALRVGFNAVSPGYFETMGIEILDGRVFDEMDAASSRTVAIINRTMATMLWPDQDPVGRRFSREAAVDVLLNVEVVGVTETTAWKVPGEPPLPTFSIPLSQLHQPMQILLVHADSNPTAMVPAIRSEIRALDPEMPVYDVRTLENHVSDGAAALYFKLPAKIVGISALIGAMLAALGLYAVIVHSVSRRTHEIGVRLALGATPSDIVRLVLSKGLLLAGVGIAVGVPLAWLVAGRIAHLLVGVGAGDSLTYVVVSLGVLLVALTASYIPARFRAARIDPAVALREE